MSVPVAVPTPPLPINVGDVILVPHRVGRDDLWVVTKVTIDASRQETKEYTSVTRTEASGPAMTLELRPVNARLEPTAEVVGG